MCLRCPPSNGVLFHDLNPRVFWKCLNPIQAADPDHALSEDFNQSDVAFELSYIVLDDLPLVVLSGAPSQSD